jgi:hypothetical protein
MVKGMADENGVAMTLPTNREDRTETMGEQVRNLNLEEIREDLASTVGEIRRRVSLGMVVGVVAGFVGIVVAAVIAITTGDHSGEGAHDER